MDLKHILDTVAGKTGAVVNLHIVNPRLLDIGDLDVLPRHYYHHGAYCHFRKIRGQQPQCAANKHRSVARARNGRMFWGPCPFGVWDLANPVFFEGDLVAVVYLGHFSDGAALAPVGDEHYAGESLQPVSDDTAAELKRQARFIADYIELVCQHWVDDGNRWIAERGQSFYKDVCMNYVATRYTEPVRLQDLADSLGVTANHLGEQIKRCVGKSFRRILQDYRIEQAKVALRSERHKSVTDIGFECGFSDSNYFSTVFKKVVGMSPREFRNMRDEV